MNDYTYSKMLKTHSWLAILRQYQTAIEMQHLASLQIGAFLRLSGVINKLQYLNEESQLLRSLDGTAYYLCENTGIGKSQGFGGGKGNGKVFSNHDIGCFKTKSQTNTKKEFIFSIWASPLISSPTFQIQFY